MLRGSREVTGTLPLPFRGRKLLQFFVPPVATAGYSSIRRIYSLGQSTLALVPKGVTFFWMKPSITSDRMSFQNVVATTRDNDDNAVLPQVTFPLAPKIHSGRD